MAEHELNLGPEEALARLKAGNDRFLTAGGQTMLQSWRPELAQGTQRPFAVVLGCSDSRTPVEIVFDVGFGSIFVVRIAGNIVAPSVVGSIEFAVSQFGTRLVVVMGHTRCGAVAATVSSIATGQGHESKNIRAVTDRIAPNVESLVRLGSGKVSEEELLREAEWANVRSGVDRLCHGSRLLEELVIEGHIQVVGAIYELETGRVGFIDAMRWPDHRPKIA